MIQSMRDISKEVKKKKPEWEETDEDSDSDDSNYQAAVEKPNQEKNSSSNFQGNDGRMP